MRGVLDTPLRNYVRGGANRPPQPAKRKRNSAQPEDAKRKRISVQPEDAKRKRDSAQPEEKRRGCAIKKMSRSRDGADGVVRPISEQILSVGLNEPPRPFPIVPVLYRIQFFGAFPFSLGARLKSLEDRGRTLRDIRKRPE